MVHEVYTSCVSEAHLPSAGQRSELGYGLLLDSAICVVLPPVHPNILLTPRVHPRSRASIVVDKVRAPFWRPPLFPARGELAGARTSSTSMHHSAVLSILLSTCLLLLLLKRGGVGTSTILWKSSVLVPLALYLCGRLSLSSSISRGTWSGPARGTGIVVDIVCSTHTIFATLPPSG